jgi:germination protein M
MKRYAPLLMIIICLMLMAGCGAKTSENTEDVSAAAASPSVSLRDTIVYYLTDTGYIVPVMKQIPWEEGIGKAALRQLVATDENTAQLAEYGLNALLPEGVEFDMRINDADGLATLNIKNLSKLKDKQAEQNMITAVVNTLVEFPRIEKVKFLVNGSDKTLPHGTSIKNPFKKCDLNVEQDGNASDYKVTLYFREVNSDTIVPVTRYIAYEPSVEAAVQELLKGPSDDSKLENCFPMGTELIDVNVAYGDAVINLSKEFENVMETPDIERAALNTLQLTCMQFNQVDRIVLKSAGAEYESASLETMAYPVYANEID